MSLDERNFRSAYYEKVGFRNVEEKKSLEILLRDKHLDRSKLKQFCLRFSVPASHRNYLWKLLLGVIPVVPVVPPLQTECQTFIMDQRKAEYKDLLHALEVMRVIDSNTPKYLVFLAVWFLHTGKLRYNIVLSPECSFVYIVQVFMQFFDDDVDIYWLAKTFYDNIQNYEGDFPKLVEASYILLEKEDNELYRHLQKHNILINLPIEKWFDQVFACILNEIALGKIWDKLCGGSCKILVFVVFYLLSVQRAKILKLTSATMVLQCIKNMSKENAESIANKAVEMWQQHGSPLTVHDKPKP